MEKQHSYNITNCTVNIVEEHYHGSEEQAETQPGAPGIKELFDSLPPSQKLILSQRWSCETPLNLAVWLDQFFGGFLRSGTDWKLLPTEDLLKSATEKLFAFSAKSGSDSNLIQFRADGLMAIAYIAMALDNYGLIGLGDVFADQNTAWTKQ
jgi:hypothetical protein